MANSDKNIKITPNISASGQPNIVYTGSGNVPIALKVLDDSYGTLSFEGSAGQLFSLNNNLSSGTIFSVNDISGMPQFDVNADGTIRVAPYGSGVYMGGVGGGTFTIQPSVKSSSGAGTSVAITAGNGVTSGAGGSLILQAGIQATTGGDGKVVVKQTTGQTSNLQEWQNSSGTALLYVTSSGSIYPGTSGGASLGVYNLGFDTLRVRYVYPESGSGTTAGWLRYDQGIGAAVSGLIGFNSAAAGASTVDVSCYRDAADTWAQRRSTNAQTFRVYNTYTDASNYERLGITWASNICTIGLAQAGTGSVRSLVIAGANATSGAGGDVTITAGNASSTGAGGNLILQAGLQATSGGDGKVVVRQKSGQTSNLQEWQNSSSGILTSIGPSGGINLLPYGTSSGNTNEIRFNELAANGTDYVGFKAPDSISTSKIWTLPSGDGATGQALITNGSGLLSWGTIANLSSYTNTSAATTSAYDLGTSNFVKANPSTSGLTINGFSSSGSYDGRMLKLVNVSNYNINIINTGTTVCVGGNNIVLGPKDGADLILDSGASVWRVF